LCRIYTNDVIFWFNYAFGPILESKFQNATQIFKSLKMVIFFFFKRLTFVLSVKSKLTSLKRVPRVSSSIFWIFFYYFFFEFFYFLFFIFYFLKKIKKIVTCQAVIVPRGSDKVTWQCQWYVSVLCQVSFS